MIRKIHTYSCNWQYIRKLSYVKGIPNVINQNEKAGNISQYTNRTHSCGELRNSNVGEKVVLCGWLQYQRIKRFIVLRDAYGVTQLVIKEEVCEAFCNILQF